MSKIGADLKSLGGESLSVGVGGGWTAFVSGQSGSNIRRQTEGDYTYFCPR